MESMKDTGSICKMGVINLSVKDYMSSLHNYIETFPTSDGTIKPALSVPTSISDMLKLCEADPVDLLIDLGFGIDEPDICTKIPSRFIMTPSEARGINTRVFLEAQKRRMEIENPNLCGRFRQLEVLEQVTSAFSSLLNNIHTIQHKDSQNANFERKSKLTPEKRRRIRQLLWKFSKQVKIVDENLSPTKAGPEVPKEDQEQPRNLKDYSNSKVFRKKHSAEDCSLVTSTASDNCNKLSDGQESEACSLSTPMKQCIYPDMKSKITTLKDSRVLSKTLKNVQQRLHPLYPESFEMEEVLSFEEDCPRAMNQDSISEMTRTNSCQSDSSGFQEEPPEPLPLQNTDQDVENMKKACQKYRGTLIEVEQRMSEQQAECYPYFSREERENMRRLHLLRQNVLKEALELEFNLDARAHQVKETISMQLEEVLEEQSRLYSELKFYNWEQDRGHTERYRSLHRAHSLPSTSSCSVHKEDQGTPINKEDSKTQSQRIDLSTILQNIKKTFRSFNNS